MDYSAGSLVG